MNYNDRNSRWDNYNDENRNRERYNSDSNQRYNNYNEDRNNRNEYQRRYDDDYRRNQSDDDMNYRMHNDFDSYRDNRSSYNNDDRYNDNRRNYDQRNRSSIGRYTGYAGAMSPSYDTMMDQGNMRRDRNRGYQSGYGNADTYSDSYREFDRNDHDNRMRNDNDRNWWDKTKDEVSSWFGDDDAGRRRNRDENRDDNHRGKGPKNYKRSDERIKEDISDRLTDHSTIDASDIDIEVKDGEVTLTGTVENKRAKRTAEDVVESVSGVKEVHNHMRLKKNFTNTDATGDTNNTTSTDKANKTTLSSNSKALNLS